MNRKEFAESRNITDAKFSKLASKAIGHVPDELDETQMNLVDELLTAPAGSLAPSKEQLHAQELKSNPLELQRALAQHVSSQAIAIWDDEMGKVSQHVSKTMYDSAKNAAAIVSEFKTNELTEDEKNLLQLELTLLLGA